MTLLEEFEELCKYIREVTGGDLVCGLCEYDAGTVGEEPMECPGFNSNECFKLKESFKQRFPSYNGHEVIRCKDCRYYDHGENPSESWSICTTHINRYFQTCAENYCAWAERKVEE